MVQNFKLMLPNSTRSILMLDLFCSSFGSIQVADPLGSWSPV